MNEKKGLKDVREKEKGRLWWGDHDGPTMVGDGVKKRSWKHMGQKVVKNESDKNETMTIWIGRERWHLLTGFEGF